MANSDSIDRLLRGALGGAAYRQPPRRTPECPPIEHIPQGLTRGWRSGERVHVADCPYCQHMVAGQWLLSAPTIGEMAAYLADSSDFAAAMELYLSRDTKASRRLLTSPFVSALAHVFRATAAAATNVNDFRRDVGDLAAAFWRSTAPVTTRHSAREQEPTSSEELRTRIAKIAARSMVLSLLPSESCEVTMMNGALMARVEPRPPASMRVHLSGGLEWTDCRVMVEAIGDCSTSANSWLANTTATLRLRSVFSQS